VANKEAIRTREYYVQGSLVALGMHSTSSAFRRAAQTPRKRLNFATQNRLAQDDDQVDGQSGQLQTPSSARPVILKLTSITET